ncbi:MAG TPA: porin family protein [Bacteroidales bacterium]|nr:porin family protein [Bacteroidales bacterium]
MMKKLSLILLVVLVSFPAFSQIKFGIKAGVSTNSITMDEIKQVTSGTTTYSIQKLEEAKYGFHGGVFMRVKVLKLFVQPEVLFASKSSAYTVTNVTTSAAKEVVQNLNKLDIPVMIGLKFGPARINVGPTGSLLLGSPKELIDSPDFKSMYSGMTFGYQAGVGLDILNKLTIDLRYEGSLKKYQTQIENLAGTTYNLDDRPNAFLFSLGFMF